MQLAQYWRLAVHLCWIRLAGSCARAFQTQATFSSWSRHGVAGIEKTDRRRACKTPHTALIRRIAGELERRHTQCPAKCGQVGVVYRSHTDTLAAKAMSQWMLPSVVHPPSALQGQVSACSRGMAFQFLSRLW